MAVLHKYLPQTNIFMHFFLLKKLVCFKIITSFVQVKTVKLH